MTLVQKIPGAFAITDPNWPVYSQPDTTTGLVTVLEAQALVASIANGAKITSWPASGGSGGVGAGQVAAENNPTLIHSALNGRAVARFDPSSAQRMRSPGASTPTLATPMTYAAVVRCTDVSSTRPVIGTRTPDYLRLDIGVGGVARLALNSATAGPAVQMADPTGVAILVGRASESGAKIFVAQSGVPIVSGESEGRAIVAGGISLASNTPGIVTFAGDIAECRSWSRALTDVDIAQLIADWRTKYGI